MTNYFDCKYLTLVGHVQSGKTNEEISYIHASVNSGLPVIFLVRNIKADQLQLVSRIMEYNKTKDLPLRVKILSQCTIEQIVKVLQQKQVIILLCNRFQLQKMKQVLQIYQGDYNLCIDEVDFSIKTKNLESSSDYLLDQIKKGANHILGATATPVAVFTTQRDVCKIVKLKSSKGYHGIESLNINLVDNCVSVDPRSDQFTINQIYSSLLQKDRAVLLHTVTKKRKNQINLMNYISNIFPQFTYVIYNGDGIRVVCKTKNILFTKSKTVNKYSQFILKYHVLENGDHFFENYSISEVLQLLVNQGDIKFISIIAGNLASRGISFVSTDYSLHLTDQYYNSGLQTHGENYLQALRILGCYNDNLPLTLWCNERCWKNIVQHHNLINELVNKTHNDSQWLSKIKEILILKPDSPLTRPALTTKFRKVSKDHFAIDLEES